MYDVQVSAVPRLVPENQEPFKKCAVIRMEFVLLWRTIMTCAKQHVN